MSSEKFLFVVLPTIAPPQLVQNFAPFSILFPQDLQYWSDTKSILVSLKALTFTSGAINLSVILFADFGEKTNRRSSHACEPCIDSTCELYVSPKLNVNVIHMLRQRMLVMVPINSTHPMSHYIRTI